MIADGFYERAQLFTWVVAGAIISFGDTLVAARIPSLVAAVALLLLLACWVTRRADVLAGIVAAGFFCMLPVTLDLAVFARFYMLHALLGVAMAVALYVAITPGRTRVARAALAVAAAGLLLLALELQITTLRLASARCDPESADARCRRRAPRYPERGYR
jgi:4-amino-4-deoxy-L-arabinose transferase-like glycosyltransferase